MLEQLTEDLLRVEQAAREAYEAALLHKSDWGERPPNPGRGYATAAVCTALKHSNRVVA